MDCHEWNSSHSSNGPFESHAAVENATAACESLPAVGINPTAGCDAHPAVRILLTGGESLPALGQFTQLVATRYQLYKIVQLDASRYQL